MDAAITGWAAAMVDDAHINEITAAFQRHYAYYARLRGETVRQQVANERSLAQAYEGRTTFELVQNALDRCEREVLVDIVPGAPTLLVVGNDGSPVSVDAHFDYEVDVLSGERSDFHALCSVHTSNKPPGKNFGNKGIGFRSVFSLAERVQVWSRLSSEPEAPWWGLELNRRMTQTVLAARMSDPAVSAGCEFLLRGESLPAVPHMGAPSFYFPLPLWSEAPPVLSDHAERLQTLVLVPLSTDQALLAARQAVAEIADFHFSFVGLRKPDAVVRVPSSGSVSFTADGLDPRVSLVGSWHEDMAGARPLAELALAAEHVLAAPGVGIAWPSAAESRKSRLFAYLPTMIPTAFGVDVHGDFQLGTDRTSVRVNGSQAIGRYNAALLEAAAELQLVAVLQHLGFVGDALNGFTTWRRVTPQAGRLTRNAVQPTPNLFRLLDPGGSSEAILVKEMKLLLFGNGSVDQAQTYARWATIAARAFAPTARNTVGTFRSFWAASGAWLDRLSGCGRGTQTWRRAALALCRSLHDAEANVVPITTQPEADDAELVTRAIQLPDPPGSRPPAARAERRLFVRQSAADDASRLSLPDAVLERGRAVTSFRFESDFLDEREPRPMGATRLERWALLQEVRQLPAETPPAIGTGRLSELQQYEVTRFAAQLFVAQFGTMKSPQQHTVQYGAAWRTAKDRAVEEVRAGRSIATLFLRTKSAMWEPARQLCLDDVDPVWCHRLQVDVPDLDVVAFLVFMGVSPAAGMVFVEGGPDGVVEPLHEPPELVDAARAPVPVSFVIRDANADLFEIVRAGWPTLKNMVEQERNGLLDTDVLVKLGDMTWFPANLCRPPIGLAQLPATLSPKSVVLRHSVLDRRDGVVWTRVRGDDALDEMLSTFGAIHGYDALGANGAAPAIRLLAHLQTLDITVIEGSPKDRQGLVDLFQDVIKAIADGAPTTVDTPLLTYLPSATEQSLTERSLAWTPPGQAAWIAEDSAPRERIRRFFPHLPLVAARLGPQVVARVSALHRRSVHVDERVRSEARASSSPATHDAAQLRATLETALPGLLALAEVSRRLPHGVNLEEAQANWRQTELRHVHDAWVELEVVTPLGNKSLGSRPWLQESWDDVMVSGGAIIYDTPPGEQRPPPLRFFAEAMAERVVDNLLVAGLWGQALGEFEAEGGPCQGELPEKFLSFLTKQGAARQEEAFRRHFRPVSVEAMALLGSKVEAALLPLGLHLRAEFASRPPRELRTNHFGGAEGQWEILSESAVEAALASAAWSPDEALHRPIFRCRDDHAGQWRRWLGEHRRAERLIALADSPDRIHVEIVANAATERLALLGFSCWRTAWAWLADFAPDLKVTTPTDEATFDAMLPRLSLFAPVESVVAAQTTEWRTAAQQFDARMAKDKTPQTAESRQQEDAIKAEVGLDAELALLPRISTETQALLDAHGSDAWDLLFRAVPPDGRVAARLRSCRDGRLTLADALHVSPIVGNAGYDILGLRQIGSKLQATLLECKGMPDSNTVRIHVSSNECKRFRGAADGDIRWRLIGVEQHGRAIDLTDQLQPLLDTEAGPLRALADKGLAPDGVLVFVRRQASQASSVPADPESAPQAERLA